MKRRKVAAADTAFDDLALLVQYGWELSEDSRSARLYSEEWTGVAAAVVSTKLWIADNLDQ